jgi:NAD-dependent DNA ligase
MTKLPTSNFEKDLLMAARYAYYVLHTPFMDDKHYDEREKEYATVYDRLPVGSDRVGDYSPAQRALALYFCLSGRIVSEPSSII